jgi:hypothetical protein
MSYSPFYLGEIKTRFSSCLCVPASVEVTRASPATDQDELRAAATDVGFVGHATEPILGEVDIGSGIIGAACGDNSRPGAPIFVSRNPGVLHSVDIFGDVGTFDGIEGEGSPLAIRRCSGRHLQKIERERERGTNEGTSSKQLIAINRIVLQTPQPVEFLNLF